MQRYISGTVQIEIDQFEPQGAQKRPALLVLHGSGGAASYWMSRFAPALSQAGVAVYAPHYFDKTSTQRATMSMILDGRHFDISSLGLPRHRMRWPTWRAGLL